MLKVIDPRQYSKANAITHSGVFHADDVLAAAILELALGDLAVARVASVPATLDKEVIVFDIGGGTYDHHQRGGNGVRDNGVPYASAGLIWRDFGAQCHLPCSCHPSSEARISLNWDDTNTVSGTRSSFTARVT